MQNSKSNLLSGMPKMFFLASPPSPRTPISSGRGREVRGARPFPADSCVAASSEAAAAAGRTSNAGCQFVRERLESRQGARLPIISPPVLTAHAIPLPPSLSSAARRLKGCSRDPVIGGNASLTRHQLRPRVPPSWRRGKLGPDSDARSWATRGSRLRAMFTDVRQAHVIASRAAAQDASWALQ
ncbi:hypothetical protein KM043_013709 [Ampulex compressa]|nr:hypothetical protein KM043_013709 [Ampulex compressa]